VSGGSGKRSTTELSTLILAGAVRTTPHQTWLGRSTSRSTTESPTPTLSSILLALTRLCRLYPRSSPHNIFYFLRTFWKNCLRSIRQFCSCRFAILCRYSSEMFPPFSWSQLINRRPFPRSPTLTWFLHNSEILKKPELSYHKPLKKSALPRKLKILSTHHIC